MHSWVISILPYLEENAIYDRFNLSRSVLDQTENPQATVLAPFVCPSDDTGGSRIFRHPTLTRGKAFGKGNYAAYVSPTHVDLQHLQPGALVAHRNNRLRHIRDGLTNTLLLAEVRTRNDELDQRALGASLERQLGPGVRHAFNKCVRQGVVHLRALVTIHYQWCAS